MGIRETADDAVKTFRQILALVADIENDRLPKMGKRSALGRQLLHILYQQPVMSPQKIAEALAVNPSTANRLIDLFVQQGILYERTGQKRNRLFEFREYLMLFER